MRLRAALSSATQYAMPFEFGRKWRTECFNARFLLPTLLCAGYTVKLIYFHLVLKKLLYQCYVFAYIYIILNASKKSEESGERIVLIHVSLAISGIQREANKKNNDCNLHYIKMYISHIQI